MDDLLLQFINILACMLSINITAYFLIQELIRRGKRSTKREEIPIMKSLLNKFSFITMLICFIKALTLLLFQIPGICQYISLRTDIPIIAIRISFTFYQITRFIHCFGDTLKITFNDNCKYYSIIIISYLIGFLILCATIILRILFVDIKPKGLYGCNTVPGEPIGAVATFFIYYAWDLAALYVYAKKLNNLNKENNDTTNRETKQARKFLHQMVFLTISMEVISFICVPMATFLLSAVLANQPYSFWYIFWNFEIISTCYIQYLMIIPNRKKYKNFIKKWSKHKCCCICRSNFVYKSVVIINEQRVTRNTPNLISIGSMSNDVPARSTDTHINIQKITLPSPPSLTNLLVTKISSDTNDTDIINVPTSDNEESSNDNNQEIIEENPSKSDNYETKADKNDILSMYIDGPQGISDRKTRNSTNPISVASQSSSDRSATSKNSKQISSSITSADSYDNSNDIQQETPSPNHCIITTPSTDNNNASIK